MELRRDAQPFGQPARLQVALAGPVRRTVTSNVGRSGDAPGVCSRGAEPAGSLYGGKIVLATLRQFISPEFLWRRWDRPYASMVRTLSFLFCVDLYRLSRSERSDLGRFYASFPETAVFILLRAKHEAICCAREEKRADRLAWSVVTRIFGTAGASALQEATWMFKTANEEEFRRISKDASYLALASVVDLKHVAGLSNADAALARGREVAELDAMGDISDAEKVLIGAHWLRCGDLIPKYFDSWAHGDRAKHAMNRIFRKLDGS